MEPRPGLYGEYAEEVRAIAATVPLSDAFLNALTGGAYPELGEPWQAGVDVVRAK